MLSVERRPSPSTLASVLSPIVAIALTLVIGLALIAATGRSPAQALESYVLFPFRDLIAWAKGGGEGLLYRPAEVLVKAAPLMLIGAGLAVGFRAGVFNIGAPGQYTLGAIGAGAVALHLPESVSPWLGLPAALVTGGALGAVWGAIPAVLRNRTGANEILTSLMLTYVAALLLDWLVRGPWKDPRGFGFPQSQDFPEAASMPLLLDGTRLHWGIVVAFAVVVIVGLVMRGHLGFRVTLTGLAPRAARFAGFGERATVLGVFLLSGALAGLAGAIEATATIGQLQPDISAGYGFAAIIVAFLGRLSPWGAVLAALVLAITYIGGENAQIDMGLPRNATSAFQGLLLLLLLACDALVDYRIRWRRRARA